MDTDKYIGRLLDNRYEILEVLGTGGMAVVYKARCHRLNRLVAIKILKDDNLDDEDFRRRFHAESQAVAMLSHPNIVSVYDVSTSITADYIVMELIEGITLKQYMEKKGVLNWKETLHFAIQIAKALQHAHSRGIVHRDIKPHNVMVLKNGSVKVTDFGIARMMSKGNTLTKEALGSVHYISPEQAKGGRVDDRSDIYSLGVVMYEMMSGRPPYDGESPVAVAIQHINGGAAMPSTLNPNIPGGLEQIIMKAMAHEPYARYASATQMLADMDEFRKNPGILFDYNAGSLDEVPNLPKPPLVLDPNRDSSIAQRTADKADGVKPRDRRDVEAVRAARRREAARRRAEAEEAKRSKVATIAIISCSLVAVLAIAIFLVVLLNGGFLARNELIEVPNLVGKEYALLGTYENFEIRLNDKVHDENAAAGLIIEQNPEAGDMVGKGNPIYVTVSLGKTPEVITMKDLSGLTSQQAVEILNNLSLDLNIRTVEEYHDTVIAGSVIRTEPMADTELTSGQTVKLVVSLGAQVKQSKMPNVVGMSADVAQNVLHANGFSNIEFLPVESAEDKDQVIKQSIPRNELVDVTTQIILEVSKGLAETTAPTTEPAPTEAPMVTKKVTIKLPVDALEDYTLTITRNGDTVYQTKVSAQSTELIVELTGSGVQYYKVYIDDVNSWIEEVDFTSP